MADGPAHVPGSAHHVPHSLLRHPEDRGQVGELISLVTLEEAVLRLVSQDLLGLEVLGLQPREVQDLHGLPAEGDIPYYHRSVGCQISRMENIEETSSQVTHFSLKSSSVMSLRRTSSIPSTSAQVHFFGTRQYPPAKLGGLMIHFSR